MINTFKKLFKGWPILFTLLLCTSLPLIAFASTPLSMGDPDLKSMETVLKNIVSWVVYLVGIVFVFVLAYGAWKAATSTGDPRALDSAKSTWTYALYGVIIVAGFFAIFSIVAGLFGYKFGLNSIFSGIFDSIDDILTAGK